MFNLYGSTWGSESSRLERRPYPSVPADTLQNGVLWIRPGRPGRANVFFLPSASPETPYIPDPALTFVYTFYRHANKHIMCKICGCEVHEYSARPAHDPRPTEGVSADILEKREPWQGDNGMNGSFGLNASLLNDAREYLGDVHGLKEEDAKGKMGKRMNGMFRDPADRLEEPRYVLNL